MNVLNEMENERVMLYVSFLHFRCLMCSHTWLPVRGKPD